MIILADFKLVNINTIIYLTIYNTLYSVTIANTSLTIYSNDKITFHWSYVSNPQLSLYLVNCLVM